MSKQFLFPQGVKESFVKSIKSVLETLHIAKFDICCDTDETELPVQFNSVNNTLETVDIATGDIILARLVKVASFADDAAAATGGVPIGGLYHTAGAVKVRLT